MKSWACPSVATVSLAVTSAPIPAPARAVGAAFRTVSWVCADGSLRQLPRIEPERRNGYALTAGEPQGYMFRGNDILLVPTVSAGTVVLAYQQRPGQLVLTSDCARLTVNEDVTSWNVNAIPPGIVVGSIIDIVSGSPNFTLKAMDLVVTVAAGGVIGTDPVLLPTDLAAGDYICLAGETCIPQLPLELHDLLAQAGAYQIASDTGSARIGTIKDSLKELREQLSVILAPRSDGSSRPIISTSNLGRWVY